MSTDLSSLVTDIQLTETQGMAMYLCPWVFFSLPLGIGPWIEGQPF